MGNEGPGGKWPKEEWQPGHLTPRKWKLTGVYCHLGEEHLPGFVTSEC